MAASAGAGEKSLLTSVETCLCVTPTTGAMAASAGSGVAGCNTCVPVARSASMAASAGAGDTSCVTCVSRCTCCCVTPTTGAMARVDVPCPVSVAHRPRDGPLCRGQPTRPGTPARPPESRTGPGMGKAPGPTRCQVGPGEPLGVLCADQVREHPPISNMTLGLFCGEKNIECRSWRCSSVLKTVMIRHVAGVVVWWRVFGGAGGCSVVRQSNDVGIFTCDWPPRRGGAGAANRGMLAFTRRSSAG